MKNNEYRFGCMLRFNLFTDKPSAESVKLCEAFGAAFDTAGELAGVKK